MLSLSLLLSRQSLVAHSRRQSNKLLLRTRFASTSSTSASKESVASEVTAVSPRFSRPSVQNVIVFVVGVSLGGWVGSHYQPKKEEERHLPDGWFRSCACEDDDKGHLTEAQKALPQKLQKIVGDENVIQGLHHSRYNLPFLKGMRLGLGNALCIVTPRRLKDVMDIFPLIVEADCVVLPQGKNTGLTGGSTPRKILDNRPTVIISMKHLDVICPVDGGDKVLCLAGAGLASLDRFIEAHFPHRESHSQLGSTFLNPTAAAGIAFGSGGTQCCRKGPAYTDRALYIQVYENKWKEKVVHVVNSLGIKQVRNTAPTDGKDSKFFNPVYKLDDYVQVIKKGYTTAIFETDDNPHHSCTAHASDVDYPKHLCKHDSEVARFNSDTRGIDCNRSEGKVLILATVHDTFPKPKSKQSFWVSFDSIETALRFRREVCLDNPTDLPIQIEYLDRDSYDVMDRSGRVLANLILKLGPSSSLVGQIWNLKAIVESLPIAGSELWIDKCLHYMNGWFPSVLPKPIREVSEVMDHHVSLSIGDFEDGNMERFLQRLETFKSQLGPDKVRVHECSEAAPALTAFRFVATPAFRTWCVGEDVQGFSVDYALPKNAGTPPDLSRCSSSDSQPLKRMRYSHFGCNVVHEDIAYGLGVDILSVKKKLKKIVEKECGGKLPAEHGHGTEYHGTQEAMKRWKKMDPWNIMNPGVAGLSTKAKYQE